MTASTLLLGLAVFGGSVWFVHYKLQHLLGSEREQGRTPFRDKLLRPPGESLRRRIDDLHDKILSEAFVISFPTVLPALLVLTYRDGNPWWFGGFWVVVAIACVLLFHRRWRILSRLRQELRNHRLGYDGEQFVAAELAPLIAKGYRIYHDFPLDMKPGGPSRHSNIDHIVIGPAGVFAIETKTRRKPLHPGPAGEAPHRVVYDGTSLTFPDGHPNHGILAQASRQAGELARWLTGSAPLPMPVVPVVALPGWMVERTGQGPVKVFNPCEFARFLPTSGGRPLTTTEIQILGDRIEAKCRDLEPAA